MASLLSPFPSLLTPHLLSPHLLTLLCGAQRNTRAPESLPKHKSTQLTRAFASASVGEERFVRVIVRG